MCCFFHKSWFPKMCCFFHKSWFDPKIYRKPQIQTIMTFEGDWVFTPRKIVFAKGIGIVIMMYVCMHVVFTLSIYLSFIRSSSNSHKTLFIYIYIFSPSCQFKICGVTRCVMLQCFFVCFQGLCLVFLSPPIFHPMFIKLKKTLFIYISHLHVNLKWVGDLEFSTSVIFMNFSTILGIRFFNISISI